MSKERYNQIIDEVYHRGYLSHVVIGVQAGLDRITGYMDGCLVEFDGFYEHFSTNPSFAYGLRAYTKEEFINKCKTDQDFSEKWGLKIEEQTLSEERRYNIWFNNNYETGMERFFNPEQLPDYHNPYYTPTPTKEITISYNGEKISFYE